MTLKVLMLGWEYPPHISGGLGTACEGLSSALSRHGVKLSFVVPFLHGDEVAPHMMLSDSAGRVPVGAAPENGANGEALVTQATRVERKGGLRTIRIPANLVPYLSPAQYEEFMSTRTSTLSKLRGEARAEPGKTFHHYGWDIFKAVNDFAHEVVEIFSGEDFDYVHAHDWMTFPAGIAISQATGKPLVAHIHSLEFDRSGEHINRDIYSVEHWGFHAASRVVAVSHYTRSMIHQRYGVPLEKISVVHNGVYPPAVVNRYRRERGWPSRVVLFLGRVTFQKGPDYFVEAAARVIPHVPDVLFVMAGSGDMLQRMVDRVRQLGIESHFHFPGFLRGADVEEMFSLADLYVMPSVSEPFGISALEAISYETPVVLSRQSGVAEVLRHVLKVDFWDVERMADLMINALLHEELRQDMISMAREEVKRLRWEASALRVIDVYRSMQ